MNLLIRNVEIASIKNTSRTHDSPTDILIKDGYISRIGSGIEIDADEIIDGKGMVAMPGLVNAHTHSAMTLFRGFADDLPLDVWLQKKIWPLEAKLTSEDVYWGVKLSLIEMIKSGTTAYADMYFFMDEEAVAVEETGIRASLSRGLIALQGNPKESLDEAVDFVSRWHNKAEGRITCMLGPHAPYTCPPDFLKEVISAADEKNVGIHIHLAETEKEIKDIRSEYKKTPIELMEETGLFNQHVLGAHCVHVSENDMDILKNNNVFVAHCPQSNLKLASGVAPLANMQKKGILVAIGTDGAASNNDLDMFDELRTAALLPKGIERDPTVVSSREVLEMATVKGARALGLENVGFLEAGNKADLILIDFDRPHLTPCYNSLTHLVYSAAASDVDTVIVDGKIVMRGREIKTIDEDKVYDEVRQRVKRYNT